MSVHAPVMLQEVIAHLDPKPGAVIVDGTFGGGGYTSAILARGAAVIAIDRDPRAVAAGAALAAAEPALTLVEGRFGALDAHVVETGRALVDGVVLDVGVSSDQLDEADRGFSFRYDAPLDMRMGADGPTAADIVNGTDPSDLAHCLRVYGEEKRAGPLSRAIAEARPIRTTGELAAICQRVVRAAKDGLHPATRTFQALRIAVNDELGELARGLAAAERVLADGGRLVVVAFHSLEDRIVKRFLAARTTAGGGSRHMPVAVTPEPSFRALTKRPVVPADAEIADNPRARSARLRAAVRTHAPAHPFDPDGLVPPLRLRSVS